MADRASSHAGFNCGTDAQGVGLTSCSCSKQGSGAAELCEASPGCRTVPGYGRVKLKDLAVFSRQFATMINSGLSLLRALTILGEQTANKRLAQIIVLVRAEVEKGVSLSAAMAKHPKVFNRLYVSMVRAGEVGGFLDQVLVKVAETFEKEVALRGKIKSAMTYPVVVFVMVLGIVGETPSHQGRIREGSLTLVELMAAVLIIAILITIAMPVASWMRCWPPPPRPPSRRRRLSARTRSRRGCVPCGPRR
jgi:hypothetical protein